MCKNLKLDFVFIFYNFNKFIMIVKLSTKISIKIFGEKKYKVLYSFG